MGYFSAVFLFTGFPRGTALNHISNRSFFLSSINEVYKVLWIQAGGFREGFTEEVVFELDLEE